MNRECLYIHNARPLMFWLISCAPVPNDLKTSRPDVARARPKDESIGSKAKQGAEKPKWTGTWQGKNEVLACNHRERVLGMVMC